MKCLLRKKIEEAINGSLSSVPGDSEAAALSVCAVLEDALDLEGNGWWDDDDDVSTAISNFYSQRLADIEAGKFTEPEDEEYILNGE